MLARKNIQLERTEENRCRWSVHCFINMEWARRISSCVAGSAGRLSQLSVPRGSSLMNSPHSLCPRALLSATPVATNHSSPFPFSARNSRTVHSGWHRTKLVCATAGSCLFIGLSFHSTAICEAKRHSPPLDIGQAKLPKLRLYQYRTCPFCCKARAYLDYTGIAYEVVEVNPLFKKEIKFSEYRSVPFIVTSDSTQVSRKLSQVLSPVFHRPLGYNLERGHRKSPDGRLSCIVSKASMVNPVYYSLDPQVKPMPTNK